MPVPKPVYSELYETNHTAWDMTSNAEDQVVSGLELFFQDILNTTRKGFHSLANYVDIDYMLWIKWVLSPVFLTFVILPSLILLFIYLTSIILYVYRYHRTRLIRRIPDYVEQGDFWTAGREIVATLWDAHAWLWHGYELNGMENLPTEGGYILVYYHGAIPLDYYYLVNRIVLLKGLLINSVVDNFLMRMPGFRIILEVFGCTTGTVDELAERLSQGDVLGISPGGVYEAQFGDHYYKVLWRERVGFARVAMRAQVPILPVFTVNIREAFRTLPFFECLWRFIYNRTRLPLRPLFGGFPVKLTTYIGSPIYPTPESTAETLRDQARDAMEGMIREHQRIPGKVLHGIMDRFWRRVQRHQD